MIKECREAIQSVNNVKYNSGNNLGGYDDDDFEDDEDLDDDFEDDEDLDDDFEDDDDYDDFDDD
jgi:hypothetical protein